VFKLLLISIVIVPILLGMQGARSPGRRGRGSALARGRASGALYWVMLYYLRVRWVGWGSG